MLKPKKKPKSKTQTLIKNCDDLIRDILPLIEPPFCVTCGKGIHETRNTRLCVGHYHRRGRYWVRWDLRNVHRQCDECNFRHEYHPYFYEQKMNTLYSQEDVRELAELATKSTKIPVGTLEEIKTTLISLKKLAGQDLQYSQEFQDTLDKLYALEAL